MKTIRMPLIALTAIFLLSLNCNDMGSPVAQIAEDRTPPDIWWTSPEAGVTLQDTVRLHLAFFDEAAVDSIHIVQKGAIVETYQPDGTEGTFGYLWDTFPDSDGVHIWEARVWDDSPAIWDNPSPCSSECATMTSNHL